MASSAPSSPSVTAALTALEFPFPQVRTALWRERRREGPGTR